MMTKKHEPTAETRTKVNVLASVGTPQDQIALVIGISKNTLIKHYRKELDTAMTMANAQVAQSLYQQAKSGNTSAAIFWLKCRAGWVDRQAVDVTTNGESVNYKPTIIELVAPNVESTDTDTA